MSTETSTEKPEEISEVQQQADNSEQNEKQEEVHKPDTFEESMKRFRDILMKENVAIVAKMRRYKQTDFRRKVVVNQLRELQKLSELSKAWVSVPYMKKKGHAPAIEVDTSKAGSNIDVLRLAINDLGWKEYPNGKVGRPCHLVWNSVNYKENPNNLGSFTNKFPGIGQCLHKISFSRILETMRQLFPEHYNFYPNTWYLPNQLTDFTLYAKSKASETPKSSPKQYYIVKPDYGTQGEGIYIINNPSEYRMSSRSHAVQEYYANPLLLDGYKFDLRVYAVMIGLDPPEVYISGEGLARLCTEKYSPPNAVNMKAPYMHLTNYSLNKKSSQFDHNQSVDRGSKRTMSSVLAHLEALGIDVSRIWRGIEDVVYKTVLAIVPHLKVNYVVEMMSHNDNNGSRNPKQIKNEKPECFQILGFDILLLNNLKPILLEVNSSPSLRLDSEIEIAPGITEYYINKVDVKVKKPLIYDILKLLEDQICQKYRIPKSTEDGSDESGWDKDDSDDDLDEEENLYELRRRWSAESEFGPHFIEIAKSNPVGASRSEVFKKDNAMSDEESHKLEFKESDLMKKDTDSDIQVTVSGTSPKIRQKQVKRQLTKLANEKSWIKSCTDDETDDGSKSENATKSCLTRISINNYKNIDDKLRILEETTVIFLNALGYRCTDVMGANQFRTFGRNCKLNLLGFNHAVIDLIYLDIHRRWSFLNNPDSSQGICYQAFLEAFFRIAVARYVDLPKRVAVNNLIEHSKKAMDTDLWDWKVCMYPKPDKFSRPKIISRSTQMQARNRFQIPINKSQYNDTTVQPSSRESQRGDNSSNKPKLQIKSKYELMKTIHQLYSNKWKQLTVKTSLNRESTNTSDNDDESVKSLPQLTSNKSSAKLTSPSSQTSASLTPNNIDIRSTVSKNVKYQYQLPDSQRKLPNFQQYDMIGNENSLNPYTVLPNTLSNSSKTSASSPKVAQKSFVTNNPYKSIMKELDVNTFINNERTKALNSINGSTWNSNHENKIKQLASIYGNSNSTKMLMKRTNLRLNSLK